MLTHYHIRAEYKDGSKRDFTVLSTCLSAARLLAEERAAIVQGQDKKSIEWRGAVCFVDCCPAEEDLPLSIKQHRVGDLFDTRSLQSFNWPVMPRTVVVG